MIFYILNKIKNKLNRFFLHNNSHNSSNWNWIIKWFHNYVKSWLVLKKEQSQNNLIWTLHTLHRQWQRWHSQHQALSKLTEIQYTMWQNFLKQSINQTIWLSMWAIENMIIRSLRIRLNNMNGKIIRHPLSTFYFK